MTFVVKKINLDDLDNKTGEYTHEDTGITMTLKSFNNPQFQKAYNMLMSRERSDNEAIRERKLDDSFLDEIGDGEKTTDELLVKAIGKFLVADWLVNDENGDKLEVSADNFILLIANIEQPMPFVQWCLDSAAEVAITNAKSLSATKKKPPTATRGKKTTKASATSK